MLMQINSLASLTDKSSVAEVAIDWCDIFPNIVIYLFQQIFRLLFLFCTRRMASFYRYVLYAITWPRG